MSDKTPRIHEHHFGGDADRFAEAMHAIEVPIVQMAFIPLSEPTASIGALLPVVSVDASRRPDLSDIGRLMVHEPAALDMNHQIWIQSHGNDTFITLLLTWDAPAACQVTLWFPVPSQFLAYYVVAHCKVFIINTGSVPSGTTLSAIAAAAIGSGISVELDSADLAPFLAKAVEMHAYKQQKGKRP